jgi:hypothetical protein
MSEIRFKTSRSKTRLPIQMVQLPLGACAADTPCISAAAARMSRVFGSTSCRRRGWPRSTSYGAGGRHSIDREVAAILCSRIASRIHAPIRWRSSRSSRSPQRATTAVSSHDLSADRDAARIRAGIPGGLPTSTRSPGAWTEMDPDGVRRTRRRLRACECLCQSSAR